MINWINEKIIPEGNLKNVMTRVVTFEDPLFGEVPFELDILLIGYTYHHLGPLDIRVSYMCDKVRPKLPRDTLVIFVDFKSVPSNRPENLGHKHGYDEAAHGDHHHRSHDTGHLSRVTCHGSFDTCRWPPW